MDIRNNTLHCMQSFTRRKNEIYSKDIQIVTTRHSNSSLCQVTDLLYYRHMLKFPIITFSTMPLFGRAFFPILAIFFSRYSWTWVPFWPQFLTVSKLNSNNVLVSRKMNETLRGSSPRHMFHRSSKDSMRTKRIDIYNIPNMNRGWLYLHLEHNVTVLVSSLSNYARTVWL